MKNLLLSIFLAFVVLSINPSFAAEASMPENKLSSDEATRAEDGGITFPEVVKAWMEIGKYYNDKYPGAAIDSDFSEDVAANFPNLTRQQVYDRKDNIRLMIKIYRIGYALYEKFKAQMLVPDAPPLIVPEDEYEKAEDAPDYIESDDAVVLTDFKKVLSYGGDKRDFEAYVAKQSREKQKKAGIKTDIEQMNSLIKKLEWRKLPYYGIIYEDPFTGKLGTGEWKNVDGVSMRLISEFSTVNNRSELKAGLHFDLPDDKFILAENHKQLNKPRFTFNDSKNLAGYEYFYPLPQRLRLKDGNDLVVYKGNFMIPLYVKTENAELPFKLSAQADFTVCDKDGNCTPRHLEADLKLDSGQGYFSSVNNFVTQSFNLIPRSKNEAFSLEKAVVDIGTEENPGQILRLEFSIKNAPRHFDVFVEGPDGILFKRPRIAVSDNKIIARLEPIQQDTALVDKQFLITAKLNTTEFLRLSRTLAKASPFDYLPASLSLGIALMAIVGGLILNFMPCVFPVLSVKLLSLTRFGAQRPENVRRSFVLTVLGIFIAFNLLAFFLSLLKLTGQAVGWGMQFQNPYFLIIMIFAITLFIAVVAGLIGFKTPNWLARRLHHGADKDSLMHFLTGVLVVFMATPCTAPYLGTALGFALGGSYFDIFVILNAVSLGLALPYLLVLAFPEIAGWLPKPGIWMERLNFFMGLMLFLTLLWLLSVLYAQTGFWPVFRLFIYLLFFVFVLIYRRFALDAVEVSEEEEYIKNSISRLYRASILSVLLFIFAVAVFDGVSHFNTVQEERNRHKVALIDYDAISKKVKNGNTVVVAVGADWCLTCKYNDVAVFSNSIVENLLKNSKTELIEVDWTEYNPEVLSFMQKFGRQGLPFYVIFSPMIPDGMVLPEVLSERSFSRIMKNIAD